MKIVVMGVSGSGKTTVGKALAVRLDYPFLDADDFHSEANVAKMSAGIPLDDSDREPWLLALNLELSSRDSVVLACSALKAKYRQSLSAGIDLRFVYLDADEEVIRKRFADRPDHFMSSSLIESQFVALEVPSTAEAIWVESGRPVEDIIERIGEEIAIW